MHPPTMLMEAMGIGPENVINIDPAPGQPNGIYGPAVITTRQPRTDGHAHGQGCGHNLFGAGSVGAAIALKRSMETHGIKGTVKLFGTPAEETVVGKVYMAKAVRLGTQSASRRFSFENK